MYGVPLREDTDQESGKGMILMSNPDPCSGRIAQNQQSQFLAATGDTAATACSFRKIGDRLPNPHALDQQQWAEDYGNEEMQHTRHYPL